jgi:hypothetical protein
MDLQIQIEIAADALYKWDSMRLYVQIKNPGGRNHD